MRLLNWIREFMFSDIFKRLEILALILQKADLVATTQSLILDRLKEMDRAMATLQQILEAQAVGAGIIMSTLEKLTELVTTIAAETSDVAATLEKVKAGAIAPSELDGVLTTMTAQNTSFNEVLIGLVAAKDSVAAIVPNIETPEEPTPVPDPADEPVVIDDPVVVPVDGITEGQIVISATQDDVGLPQVPAIDIQ